MTSNVPGNLRAKQPGGKYLINAQRDVQPNNDPLQKSFVSGSRCILFSIVPVLFARALSKERKHILVLFLSDTKTVFFQGPEAIGGP